MVSATTDAASARCLRESACSSLSSASGSLVLDNTRSGNHSNVTTATYIGGGGGGGKSEMGKGGKAEETSLNTDKIDEHILKA